MKFDIFYVPINDRVDSTRKREDNIYDLYAELQIILVIPNFEKGKKHRTRLSFNLRLKFG